MKILTDAEWMAHAEAARREIARLRPEFRSLGASEVCFVPFPSGQGGGTIHELRRSSDGLAGRRLATYRLTPCK